MTPSTPNISWRPGIAALLLFATVPLHAATIAVQPRWIVGETVRYVAVRNLSQESASQRHDEAAQVFQDVLRVRKKSKDAYLLDWQRVVPNAAFEPRVQAELQFRLPAVMRLITNGIQLNLLLDPSANPVAIDNARQLAAEIDAALRQFNANAARYPVLTPWRRHFLELEPLRDEAILSTHYLRQAAILLAPVGREYDADAPRIEQAAFPNPAGGAAFPAHTSFRLSASDPKRQRAGIDISTSIDAGQSGAAVAQLARSIAPKTAVIETPTIGLSDEAHYEVDLRSGWPERIEWARTTTVSTGAGGTSVRQRDVQSHERIDQNARHVATLTPEIINFSPFTAVLTASREGPRPFFAMVMKAGFRRQADGGWKPDREPVALVDNPAAYLGCAAGPVSLEDSIAFKPSTEVYLQHDPGWPKQLEVRAGNDAASADNRSGCMRFAGNQPRAKFPFLGTGQALTITAEGQTLRAFTVPEGFVPYALVRYWSGEMLPAPARLDTLVLGKDPDYVVATFRAGFGAVAPIRKVEFRVVLPDAWIEDQAGEAREAALRRGAAMRAYLAACPVPAVPGGEACAAKSHPHDLRLLAPALGIGQ